MGSLGRLLFGKVNFLASEEHLQFRYKMLCIVMLTGALATLVFIVGNHSNINPITGPHIRSMILFTTITLLLWLLLRGRRQLYLKIAWLFEITCLLEYVSALIYVPQDELRILWFFTNIPGVYILLGQKPGMVITLLCVIGLAIGNASLSDPYSANAVATACVSLIYLGTFFHIYSDRSVSYFIRMRDSNERLSHMASHDALTGVLNAGAYYAICDQLIELSKRNGSAYAVLFADLDHFKAINDTYGHVAGDAVLKSVAQALQQHIRHSDVLGRVGGEEFSIFLPNTDEKGAWKVAENLRENVENLMPVSGKIQLKITASIGVAAKDGDLATIIDIQQQADQAMYLAKKAGRNRVSGCGCCPTPH